VSRVLSDCHGRGITVVMVTHDEQLAGRLASRLVRMHYGKLAEIAP
jgi:ABC-type sulfate/molybdate transport systems ATPase subunit